MFTVDIDTGGTFTDGFFRKDDMIEIVKVPTTPHDVTECFLDCIEEGASRFDVPTDQLLQETSTLRFSTTIGTNMVIEKTGSEVGLLVTEGAKESLYADGEPAISGFIDDSMIAEVSERTTDSGEVEETPDHDEVVRKVKGLLANGARIVAVALENTYHNPQNENRVKGIIEDEYPRHYLGSVQVMLSNEVTDRPNDYLRTTSTVLNSYLHKGMRSSLYKAEDKVRDNGYEDPLLIGHSSGGSARVAKTTAINTYNSGPACGVVGAQFLADLYDLDNLISTDMGGTSIDLSVITDGEYDYTLRPEIHGTPIDIPLIQVETAGVGGGSIASVEGGTLSVGPQSAGANPGPACYGLGGEEPTTTDADVVLGYINPDYFVGGSWQLEADRAHDSIESHVAEPLGISVEEAAWKIKQIADRTIADELGDVVDKHGIDDEASILAYGGAGATHCVGYTSELEFDHVFLSPYSPVFSAFGSATLDVVHRYSEPLYADLERTDGQLSLTETDQLHERVTSLVEEAERDMAGEGFEPDELEFTLNVIANEGDSEHLFQLTEGWQEQLEDTITSTIETQHPRPEDLDVTMVQLVSIGPTPELELPTKKLQGSDPEAALKERRETYWDGEWVDTPVYQREDLRPGNVVEGPAIIEFKYTTYVIEDGWEYEIDEHDVDHLYDR